MKIGKCEKCDVVGMFDGSECQECGGKVIDIESALSNLLALIIGDGGHYEEEHGTQKAVEAAADKVTALRSQRDAYYSWHSEQGREIIALRRALQNCNEYLTKNHPERVKYPEYIEYHLWYAVNIALGEIIPFCSPDPTPLTREEAQGGGMA